MPNSMPGNYWWSVYLTRAMFNFMIVIFQLYPTDTAIIDYHKKEMADAKQYARKLLVVSLSDKGPDELCLTS